jgi:hypothetical protein
VVAQARYLERQRQKKQARVDEIAGRVARFLYSEIATVTRTGPALSRAQRQRILGEIYDRAMAILLSKTAAEQENAGQTHASVKTKA